MNHTITSKTGSVAEATGAIQQAIDDCSRSGGGRVTVPAGVFTIGTINLKSNVELHLEHGALLKASGNLDDYNTNDAFFQNSFLPAEEWNGSHLILALEVENVSITGFGVIDGSGELFLRAAQTAGSKLVHLAQRPRACQRQKTAAPRTNGLLLRM